MLKLLIAVDGSDHAGRALHVAARLRKETSGLQALLLNVRERPAYHGSLPVFDLPDIERSLAAAQVALLEAALTHARVAGLDEARTCGVVGNAAAEEIVRVAREERVDLIAMGTRGMTRLGGLLVGSVAQRVVHLAHVPVLLAK